MLSTWKSPRRRGWPTQLTRFGQGSAKLLTIIETLTDNLLEKFEHSCPFSGLVR